MNRHRWLALLVALLAASLSLAACGDDDDDEGGGGGGGGTAEVKQIPRDPANSDITITVGSKNFTEQKVLGEIYAQALEAAGFKVKRQLNLGDEQTALRALESGEIDGYPEYTGTALGSFFGVDSNEIPKDPKQAYEDALQGFAKKNLTALLPTPFTSSNEVAVTKETADELGLEKISDLAEHDQDLTLYGSPECRQRNDCLLGLQKVYGLKFKKFVPVDIALRHDVLEKGQADVSIVFTTDPQITRNEEVLLEDDKGMFPPYNSTFVIRDETLNKARKAIGTAIIRAGGGLTDTVMQELNARVDLDKKTPREVASEYLEESGLLP